MTFNGTEIPGIYQVDVQGRDRRVRDFFAVNVDPTESDLQQVALQEAVDRVGAQMEVTSTLEDLDQTLNAYRMGKEIWGELLVIVLICMLIEGVLSNHERATPEAPALS